MALKDSFINLNKALRTTLQNVPAVVDTLIRGLNDIADAADELSTYSTDEKVVGKWIDGSVLYESTVEYGALPNATGVSKAHGIANIDIITSIDAIACRSNGTSLTIPFIQSNGNISVYADRTNTYITTDSDRSGYNGYITLRYTKTTANRAPKDDVKNGGDELDVKPVEEPDVKTADEPAEELKK